MTDSTQPEALRLADELEFVSGGWGVADQCCAELRRQHTRIAELESELEAVGAGGVQALSAAPAVAAPAAPTPEHIAAMERAWLWMDNQADQQSKGGHATFDLMMLREERDTLRAAIDAAHKAAPVEGNSGFDHKTAADLLNNKTVSDEAVRKFVATSRWAHDERAALSAMLLSVRGVLASREAEIALLKKALMEAEAAPQQEAQEPAAYVHVPHSTVEGKVRPVVSFEKYQQDYADGIYSTRIPLYTAPQPAPAPLSDDTKDAARYRWVRATTNYVTSNGERIDVRNMPEKWDAAIDAAIAAQGGKA